MILNPQLKMIESLIEKNDGNLSAAIRDCIDFVGFCIEKVGNLDRAKEILYFNQTNDLRINDKIILRVEKVIKNPLKPMDSILPEGPISEHGYGNKIYQRLEEKLKEKDESVNKKYSVPIPAQASNKDLDRKEMGI